MAQRRVLVVDDDATTRLVLESGLSARGYHVMVGADDPVIDAAVLNRLKANVGKAFPKIVATFLADLEKRILAMRAACVHPDAAALADEAHGARARAWRRCAG